MCSFSVCLLWDRCNSFENWGERFPWQSSLSLISSLALCCLSLGSYASTNMPFWFHEVPGTEKGYTESSLFQMQKLMYPGTKWFVGMMQLKTGCISRGTELAKVGALRSSQTVLYDLYADFQEEHSCGSAYLSAAFLLFYNAHIDTFT